MIVSFVNEHLQDFLLLLVPFGKNYPTVSSKLSAVLHFISIGKYSDNLLWLALPDTNISLA